MPAAIEIVFEHPYHRTLTLDLHIATLGTVGRCNNPGAATVCCRLTDLGGLVTNVLTWQQALLVEVGKEPDHQGDNNADVSLVRRDATPGLLFRSSVAKGRMSIVSIKSIAQLDREQAAPYVAKNTPP